MSISPVTQQLQQVAELIRQHKDAIRNALGSPPTGTGTSFSSSMKRTFSREDYQKVAKALSVPEDQAEQICQLWPVYQLGFEDGRQNSK